MSPLKMRMRPTRFSKTEIEACVSGRGAKRDGIPTLREHDGKLRENWYIASLSSELVDGKPLSATIYETPLVLYRKPDGTVAAVIDRCLHRGAKLSEGTCTSGKLRCPYHGWAYDSEGRVCEVPSEGLASTVKNWKLSSYPVVEQDGVIWVWMGDSAPECGPNWRFPFCADRSWHGYFMVTDFHNEVTHLVENFMDVPHTVYVHDKWFRNRREIKVPISVELGRARVLVTYEQPNDTIGFTSKILNPSGQPMRHTDEFIFPNITRVDYQFGDRGYVINSQCTPIGRYHTRVYTWIAYCLFPDETGSILARGLQRYLQPLLGLPMRLYTRQVIEQDVEIMKNQGSSLLALDEQGFGQPFRSTAADELHIAIERLREMGRVGDSRLGTVRWTKEREIWI